METNSFIELTKTDICVSDISCVEYQWGSEKKEYTQGRDLNILSFSMNGRKRLLSPDSATVVFDAADACVCFIAAGTPYVSEVTADKDASGYTACIRFRITDKNGNNILVSDKVLYLDSINKEFFLHQFKKVIGEYVAVNTNTLALKGAFYKLLCSFVESMQEELHSNSEFEDLLPAINYLNNNLGSNITVVELAKMCFVSKSHFTKRFKKYTNGMTLTEYRNKMRVDKAKELLEDPMWTTTLISEALGFYDISHFCRVYKKYTGEALSNVKNHKM